MYSNWNSAGSQRPIEGLQGRYFLPLAALVVLAFPSWPARPGPKRGPPRSSATALGRPAPPSASGPVVARYYLPS